MPDPTHRPADDPPADLPGYIQDFGFLIAVSAVSWCVVCASENTGRFLGEAAAQLIGRPLDTVLLPEAVHTLRGHLHGALAGDGTAHVLDVALGADLVCDVALSVVGDVILIACEPATGKHAYLASVPEVLTRLCRTESGPSFYRAVARELRALTGFDRVMVVRFDEGDSGEVMGESARGDLVPWLGQHCPVSGILPPALQPSARNPLLIVPDIDAPISAIAQPRDAEGQPLDLTTTILQAASIADLDALRAMGVRAAMAIAVLRADRRWGLLICHHQSPHHVAFAGRLAAKLFGQMISLMMENREREADAAYEARGQLLLQRLVSATANEALGPESLLAHLDGTADLLACDGMGLCIDGRSALRGVTPPQPQVSALIEWLRTKNIVRTYASDDLIADDPRARAFTDGATGLLVLPLSRPARDYLIFFRPSKRWRSVEIRVAESLRAGLLEVILRLSDITAAERRRSEQRQELLIAELNHRVRNILGLIRGVISQSAGSSQTVEAYAGVIGGRIQALARAHDQITSKQWGPSLFTTLVAAESGAYLAGAVERIAIAGPDALIGPDAFTTIALVMHEMITNSAKYGALSDKRGRVEIVTHFNGQGRYVINWTELGGPPVRPPSRRGFGSTVIERSIEHDLKGEAHVEYALAGLRAQFVIPAAYVDATTPTAPDEAASETSINAGWVPDDVLLVEDNMIIALDAEDMVRKLGVSSVRIASNVSDALTLIAERKPDFALLDVNLGSETSFDIASALVKHGVPIAFASGYGEQVAFPDNVATIARVRKPFSIGALREAITAAQPRTGE